MLSRLARGLATSRSFHSSAPRCSDSLSQHIDRSTNNDKTPFDFTVKNYEKVKTILGRYPKNYKKSAIMPLLDLAQRQNNNHLTLGAMKKVARICEVPDMAVYEVATFYTMYNREPVGKYFIQHCGTSPCMACGAEEIKATILEHLGISDGETTKDGLFTFLEVECLGACANAPMVQINDDFYECLTPDTTRQLLDDIRAGNPPPMTKYGSRPMNGQFSCEGPMGKTNLRDLSKVSGPYCRDLSGAGETVDPASVAKEMYGR